MQFAYYRRLSKADRARYDRSDEVPRVPLSDAQTLQALIPAIAAGLARDERTAVSRASRALVDALLAQMKAPPVIVRVLAVRPVSDDSELHGLYEVERDKKPVIRVWMRTARHKRPAALRTFVRTILHEIVHHLDMTVLDLAPSFHTRGFFQRESHLAAQILGRRPRKAVAAPDEPARPVKSTDAQLSLFGVPRTHDV